MSPDRTSLRVLVADDSVDVRRRLVEMIAQVPAIEVVAEEGDVHHALASVRAIQPEVVVLDLQLADGNGIVALKRIKREYPETHVIILTNHSNEFYRNSCLKAGASHFFDKSLEFEAVREALEDLTLAR